MPAVLVDEKEWENHVMSLLGSLLSGLDEQQASETRSAFHDIARWGQVADKFIESAMVDPEEGLLAYAITPVDLRRIEKLIRARFYLDMIVKHLSAVIYARTVDDEVIIPKSEYIVSRQ